MPRHRIEAPRSRTLWPAAAKSARRVPVRAASRRKTGGHARPVVIPEWRLRLALSQRRMLKGAGRRLLVSPWFAAGAGVVIATGAIVIAPHTNLAIDVNQCTLASCAKVIPQGVVVPPVPDDTGSPMPVPNPLSVPAGTTFSYEVLDQSSWDGFSMQITIRAPHSLGNWTLSFVIPGARDVYVLGARWVQSGTDGGTASNYYGGTESAGSAPISGHQSGGDGGSGQDSKTVQFQVRGSGTPGTPADCLYKGAACQFQQSRSQAGTNWPGSG